MTPAGLQAQHSGDRLPVDTFCLTSGSPARPDGPAGVNRGDEMEHPIAKARREIFKALGIERPDTAQFLKLEGILSELYQRGFDDGGKVEE